MRDAQAGPLPRLSITTVMRTFGLTARALHYYEQRGLVEARRDRARTRFYDPVAWDRIAWITRLRRAHIALADIRELLDLRDEAARRVFAAGLVTRRRERLLVDLAAVNAAFAELGREAAAAPGTTAGDSGSPRPRTAVRLEVRSQ